MTYLVGADTPHTTLVSFLQRLEAASTWLGVEDIQASLASLEEVFLNIAKQVRLRGGGALVLVAAGVVAWGRSTEGRGEANPTCACIEPGLWARGGQVC